MAAAVSKSTPALASMLLSMPVLVSSSAMDSVPMGSVATSSVIGSMSVSVMGAGAPVFSVMGTIDVEVVVVDEWVTDLYVCVYVCVCVCLVAMPLHEADMEPDADAADANGDTNGDATGDANGGDADVNGGALVLIRTAAGAESDIDIGDSPAPAAAPPL